ncbi:MAG: hypothetical protein LBK42_11840 [Propionibacteriaceae bacterium]|nr:hypothetical protein [Propionibacteriaceae bacterium]
MTADEVATVQAAQQIVFARCITGSDALEDVTRDAARQELDHRAEANHWLLGYWDADYMAQHGAAPAISQVTLGGNLEVDKVKGRECVYSDNFEALHVIDRSTVSNDGAAQKLVQYSSEAWDKTVADPRFQELQAERDACLTDAGYTLDQNSKLSGVELRDDWSAEERLKAQLAEAQCADSLDFTQRAANIEATYEQQAIDAHEAELVTLRQKAAERVDRATVILIEAGII